MGLVDYSDSDESESERTELTPAVKPPVVPAKSTFQKVVDRSNPGKIRVSLPQPGTSQTDEPPAKRPKIGGGGLGGFNSFLPPPKRSGTTTSDGSIGNTKRRTGLAPGVSLKTGGAPGFSREPEPELFKEEQEYDAEESENGGGLSLPPSRVPAELTQKPAEEVKLVGKPLMFKPLSVARKPAKKTKAVDSILQKSKSPDAATKSTNVTVEQQTQRPKVSLFSISSEIEPAVTESSGEYQPMIYGAAQTEESEVNSSFENNYGDSHAHLPPHIVPHSSNPPFGAQSLDNIASDLNLSAAERRQLFGRQKGSNMASATKIINFNIDEEYKHNEELRAAGEQVTHNPVRAIASGKHSLQQLVNAAASQKEALEESFAAGRNNRKEAGSRYGW